MHRAYQPITPANNKLLMQKWDTIRYNRHRKKVSEAAPQIDNKPPKTYMHLHLKLKNLQIEEERLATVEKENRILLEKMSYIMRTRGLVDNRNDYQQKSLNKTKRQRELLRLTHENQAILKRITAKEPHYNHLEWEEDYKFKQRYMENIAKYPRYWHKRVKLVPISPRSSSRDQRPSEEKLKKKEEGAVAAEEGGDKGAEAAEAEKKEAKEEKETEEAEKKADESDAKEAEKEEAKAEETKETEETEKEIEKSDATEAEKEEESNETEEDENEDKPAENEIEKSGDDSNEKEAEGEDEAVKEKEKEELVAE